MIEKWEMTVIGTMMRALVTQLVVAFVIAALATGTIAALDFPKLTSLPKVVGIDELPNGSRLMSCADASQACLSAYEPALTITPSQVMTTRWGEFEQRRSSMIDPVEFLLALTERKTSILDPGERR